MRSDGRADNARDEANGNSELLSRLRLSTRGPATEPGPDCLSDDIIAALAEGAVDAATRAASLPHLATCARCRAAVASVGGALDDPEVGREIAATEAPGTRRRRYAAAAVLPLAAAAALVFLLLPGTPRGPGTVHRAPAGSSPAPVPVAPLGLVADGRALHWGSVPAADRYRVVVFGADGHTLYESLLPDTSVVLPDSVLLAPRSRYLWKVEARVGWNRWSASPLVEFSIADRTP